MTKGWTWTGIVLWGVYLGLLGILLPHTAWAFGQFEPVGPGWLGVPWGIVTAWAGAFAFEAAIATLTHKLAKHIEQVGRRGRNAWDRFRIRYLNAYAAGLIVSVFVSALANLAHAVEYGRSIKVNVDRPGLFVLYVIAFGAILPFVSLLFARVLSNVAETGADDPELVKAQGVIRQLQKAIREKDSQLAQLEAGVDHLVAEQTAQIFDGEAKERIVAASQRWPELPQRSLAVVAGTSLSYVNQVLKENGTGGQDG